MQRNFKELQKFNQWWLWIILLIFPILSFGNYDGAGINFYYVLIGILIPSLFYFLQLRTEVNEQGFFYQFFPIHFSYHKISFEEIESVEAIDYKPIKDYGGWGIKFGFKAKSYTTSGNQGVMLKLKGGKNLLFGSQKNKELEKILKFYLRATWELWYSSFFYPFEQVSIFPL